MNDRSPIGKTRSRLLGALLAVGICVLAGCATTDDTENLSERPWNTPKSWEGGLPAGMMEGR